MNLPLISRRLATRAMVDTVLLACCSLTMAANHPVSVTETAAFVTRDKVSVRISVFVEDLFLFHNLKPNAEDFLEPTIIRSGIEKHEQFLLERFVIRDVEGVKLSGRVVGVKEFEMPPEGVPMAELMAHKLEFRLEYELLKPPEFLTFSQHLVDQDVLIPAEMKLVIKQENAGTPFGAVLQPDHPETVRFSWDNPALPAEASEEEWEEWYQKQREETLGITSYSSVYSFLYIEGFEVRHEVLVPLLSLEASVLIARDDDAFLDIAEQDAARQQIEAYFTSGNPIEIDGVVVKPNVDRIDFYGLDFKDFAVQAERRKVSMANARVGVILSYSTKGSPGTVKLTWDRFNRHVWSTNVIVFAYDEAHKVTLSRIGNANTYQWQNPGRPPAPQLNEVQATLPPAPKMRLPILTIICACLLPVAVLFFKRPMRLQAIIVLIVVSAATWPLLGWEVKRPFAPRPTVSPNEAQAIFASLHKNTYRAFDYRDESEIYDALAKSVDGRLLRDLYLKMRRGLEMQEQGGAVSRVREVVIEEGSQPPSPVEATHDARGFGFRCKWTVKGSVQHWGHLHSRTNQYVALFRVEPRDNAWKITKMEVLDEQRLKFETSLRGL
ncbi:MAG TPA: hypothetical protein QF564_06210 [Pirellulaceae bacterium]|nr:hypothetical protein [Pirellulaceae bacterium]